MGSRLVMDKKDYDYYQFGIPFSVLVGRKKEKFILAELGKRHPCFSDEFCFDSKLGLDKNGFLSEVVVMNKYRLSEMRGKFPGKRLGICEKRDSFFDTGIVSFWKKWGFVVVLGIAILFLGVLIAACGESNQKFIENENSIETNLTEEVELGEGIAISDFFWKVKNSKGRINWLEWRINGGNESFTAEVSLMFPEQILEIEESFLVSAVSYAEGMPLMVVNAKKTYLPGNLNQGNTMEYVDFAPLVRDVLKSERSEKVEIIEEKVMPYSLRFSFTDVGAEVGNVVCRLGEFVKRNNISVSYLKIRNVDESVFDVQLDFSGVAAKGIDLELAGRTLELMKKPVAKKKEVKVTERSVKTEEVLGTKMGEVTYADGSKLVFYKNSLGKTVKRKEFSK